MAYYCSTLPLLFVHTRWVIRDYVLFLKCVWLWLLYVTGWLSCKSGMGSVYSSCTQGRHKPIGTCFWIKCRWKRSRLHGMGRPCSKDVCWYRYGEWSRLKRANCFAELMDPFRTSTCCLNPHIQAHFLPVEDFSEMVILRKLTGGLNQGMGPVEVLTGRVWALKTANESTRNVPLIVSSNLDCFSFWFDYIFLHNKKNCMHLTTLSP